MQESQTGSSSARRFMWVMLGAGILALVFVLLGGQRSGSSAAGGRGGAGEGVLAGSSRPSGRGLASSGRRAAQPRRSVAAIGRVMFRTTWGDGPGQLGRKVAQEASPEGPASFAVDAAGRAFVLDQVNGRIQVIDNGRVIRSILLGGDTFEDLALLPGGHVAVLDRLARRSVSLLDAKGRLVSEVDLEGPGVAEGGAVTGLFGRADGLWVEVAHQRLVRVADANGRPDPQRTTVPGRFSADGSQLLQAALDGRYAAEIVTRPSTTPGAAAQRLARLDFPMRIAHLTALESDPFGRVYLGAEMMRHRATPPYDLIDQASALVVVSPAGRELQRITLPPVTTALEHLRSVRVGPGGQVWHLGFDAFGATLRRY